MSKIANIKNFDIANGSGIGVSVFFSGCDANPKCKGCFNSEAWDKNFGQEYTLNVEKKILELLGNPHIDHLAILGGCPLTQYNIQAVTQLITKAKNEYPRKKIWLWTWRRWEDLTQQEMFVVKNIDILVDGRFVEREKDLTLKWRGSKNQRVISVKDTLERGEIVEYCE